MVRLQLNTSPTYTDLISLATAKSFLRVSNDAEDTLITTMIGAAIEVAQNYTNSKFLETQYTMFMETWSDVYVSNHYTTTISNGTYLTTGGYLGRDGLNQIILPYAPLDSITHVKYYDGTNTQQTWTENTDYSVHTFINQKGFIEIMDGIDFPTLYDRADAVEIKFKAGYGTGASDAAFAIESCLFVGWDKWSIAGSGGYCTVRNCTLVLDESSQSTSYLMYWSGTNVSVFNTIFYGGDSSVDYGLRFQSASDTHTAKNCISFGATGDPYLNTGSPTVSSQLETNTDVASSGATVFTALGDADIDDDYTINSAGLAYQRGLAGELPSDGKDVNGNDFHETTPNIGAFATVVSGWSGGANVGGIAAANISTVLGALRANISKIIGV